MAYQKVNKSAKFKQKKKENGCRKGTANVTCEIGFSFTKTLTDQTYISSCQSSFVRSSDVDIDISTLEDDLENVFANDVDLGRSAAKMECASGDLDNILDHINQSAMSSSIESSGVVRVQSIWPNFLTDKLSINNHRIGNMNRKQLQRCLFDHGLNQLGSVYVLRRRLQEFVRRIYDALAHQLADKQTGAVPSNGVEPRHSQYIVKQNYGAVINFADMFDDSSDDETRSAERPCKSGQLSTTFTSSPCLNSFQKVSLEDIYPKRLRQCVTLTPDTFYSYFLVIDLEATCDDRWDHTAAARDQLQYPHEIIEFPVLLYDTQKRRCVSVFHAYIQPQLKPQLTKFCTKLTGIEQHQMDTAQPFREVLARLESWLIDQHGLASHRCAVVCDCSSDMAKFMRLQCARAGCRVPDWAKVWLNLTRAYRIFYKVPLGHRINLATMLQDCGLSFTGTPHRGLDDAINMLRVLRCLLADGCLARVNERLELGRPPSYISSVTRTFAESASGFMGCQLPKTPVFRTLTGKCSASGHSSERAEARIGSAGNGSLITSPAKTQLATAAHTGTAVGGELPSFEVNVADPEEQPRDDAQEELLQRLIELKIQRSDTVRWRNS